MKQTPFPFSMDNIGAALDLVPNLYSRTGEIGVYQRVPQATRNVTIVRRNNRVTLLDPVDPRAPRQELNRTNAKSVSFDIPTFKAGDVLTPSDIQGFTAFKAGEKQLRSQAEAYNRRLLKTREPHDQTFEFYRIQGLKGIISNPDGSEMYNLFSEFDISKKTIYFDLDNPDSDIFAKIEELEDHIAINLHGDVSNGTHVLSAADFVRKLKRHPKYEQYLKNHSAALMQIAASRVNATSPNAQRAVHIENTTFESYTGQGLNSEGETIQYIANGDGHAFPSGTINSFFEYDAPPERMGEVNIAPSEEIHVYPHELPQGKGIDIDTESAKLCLPARPEVLVEVKAGPAP